MLSSNNLLLSPPVGYWCTHPHCMAVLPDAFSKNRMCQFSTKTTIPKIKKKKNNALYRSYLLDMTTCTHLYTRIHVYLKN